MSRDCCSSASWRQADCPLCGESCREVSQQTMFYHLNIPWTQDPDPVAHYFCGNRDCEITYFNQNGNRYTRIVLRPETRTALANDMVCFCYGIDAETARNEPPAKGFVIEQTRNKACACDSRNPSGRCCLKDFPE